MVDVFENGTIDKATVTAKVLRDKIRNTPRPPKYETGIYGLDFALKGGIELGSLVLLAGQSFVCKTHLTIEILSHVVKHNSAVFYNFEMGDIRIIDKLEKQFESQSQWDNLIINSEDRELGLLCSDINIHAKQGIKYFAIDSRMKIDVKGNEPEYQRISKITKELSRVAQKNDIIIFLINQMSNDAIANKTFTFKGSGDAIYDTDLAFFYLKDPDSNERALVCTKNRQADGNEFKLKMELSSCGRITMAIGGGEHQTVPAETVEYNHYDMAVI
jgi:KaiC/GvpD/RAD55 family RecA-like ATPase